MKTKFFLTLLLSFFFYLLSSQVPQGFNYQAIARDGNGEAIISSFTIKVEILNQAADTVFWIETHSVIPTSYGLISFIVGQGSWVGGTTTNFADIDWISRPRYLKTSASYPGPGYTEMGTTQLMSVPYALVAKDIGGTIDKLDIKGTTTDYEEALFEVKNKDGQTVFAVYNEGIRAYVNDIDAKGAKGGFAIGGFGSTKTIPHEYLFISGDSVRIYIDNGDEDKGAKGGFAIGGFGTVKGLNQKYLTVSNDSVRIYIDNKDTDKGVKGGFAIGGYGTAKGKPQDLFTVNNDSVRIYLDKAGTDKGVKGGFSIGGFGNTKGFENEYLRVTTDSVKVSKSLLIPRLTLDEREHLPFVPGEALIIFNTTEGCMQIFKNKVWSNIWCFNCAPDFIIQPVDNTICSGNNVTIFVSASGMNLNYQWQQSIDNGNTWNNMSNGGSNPVISGAKGYTLTLTNVPVEYHSYKHRCVVTGSCLPNVISNAVTLNVGSAPPEITLQPADQPVYAQCTASFTIESPGLVEMYQWQESSDGGTTWSNISEGGDGPVFSGSTTSFLSLTYVPLAYDNFKFRCIVSNLCGADAISDAATLNVIGSNPIAIQPIDKIVYVGQKIIFEMLVGGFNYDFQWQESRDGGLSWIDLVNGGTNPEYYFTNNTDLSLTNVPLSYNGYKYRCVISHYCQPDVISDVVTLTVATASPVSDIDGNTYNTVGIGSQLWMAENLKTTKYRNGNLIGTTTPADLAIPNDNTSKYQWAYGGNESNVATYGRLYTWYAITDSRNVCPTGWHVPTIAEWTTLTDYLTYNHYGYQGSGSDIAKSMAATSGWNPNSTPGNPGNDQASNNSSGFTALPGGGRGPEGFYSIVASGLWWSATETGAADASRCTLHASVNSMNKDSTNKNSGASVRCVKD
jgi:uncharacterized protein (TIGR02145 family)